MTDRELKIELAKASLMGGGGVYYAMECYDWINEESKDLEKIDVRELAAEAKRTGLRIRRRCLNAGISTIGDLVRLGRNRFRALPQVGDTMCDEIAEVLREKYKVQNW